MLLKRLSSSPVEAPQIKVRLTRVAWLSILLGLVIEGLLILVHLDAFEAIAPVVAGTVQKVSWAFLVCMGLALGRVVSKGDPLWAGLAGLVTAPLAFNIAGGLHKGVAEFMAIANVASDAPSSLIIALIRGVEYLCLGAAIVWLGERTWGGAAAHIGAGLGAGAIFGGIILALSPQAAASTTALASLAINELLFPIGCALVLYASSAVGKQVVGEAG